MSSTACADALCLRLQRLEPSLPLHAPLDSSTNVNACRNSECFPMLHVLGAYHSFLEETLGTGKGSDGQHGAGYQHDGLLSGHNMVEMQHRCHNEFDGGSTFMKDGGGAAFLRRWPNNDKVLVAECMTGMMWYPNLAARWSREWSGAYWPCKAEHVRTHGARAFRSKFMWSKCKPLALAAHDEAHGTGGVGNEATPPFLLRALYPPSASPKVLLVLRHPTDRLETSFWLHPHYPKQYGHTAEGLDKYVVEHLKLFTSCEARHSTRRCAFLFENLDVHNTGGFFACDQVIRGVYWPFVAEWRAAFGGDLLVIKSEDLLDDPATHRARVLAFLGLPPPPPGSSVASGPPSYAAMHAASLRSYGAQPMLNSTRAALDAFYTPHSTRLAAMLDWSERSGWPASKPLQPAAYALGAGIRYRRYGPHYPSNQPTQYNVTAGDTDDRDGAAKTNSALLRGNKGRGRSGGGRRRTRGSSRERVV